MYSTKSISIIWTTTCHCRSLIQVFFYLSFFFVDVVAFFPKLNKALLYLVCVPNKVKGESSDVNIQFFVCVCYRIDWEDRKDGGESVGELLKDS